MTAHWVKFWPESWQAGAQYLTPTEEYVYFRVCLAIWDTGEPVHYDRVGILCKGIDGWQDALENLIRQKKLKYVRGPASGKLTNSLAREVVKDVQSVKSARSKAGSAGAKSRWNHKKSGNGNCHADANGKTPKNPPSDDGKRNAEERRERDNPLTPTADASGGTRSDNLSKGQPRGSPRANGTNPRANRTNSRAKNVDAQGGRYTNRCRFCDREAVGATGSTPHCRQHASEAHKYPNLGRRREHEPPTPTHAKATGS
jgi:hypothetical protein